jgi:hypothetical protein
MVEHVTPVEVLNELVSGEGDEPLSCSVTPLSSK